MPKQYKTVQGDMWDSIAFKLYGNEKYMNDLLKANQEYNRVVIFPAGTILTCPDVVVTKAKDLPPWKR